MLKFVAECVLVAVLSQIILAQKTVDDPRLWDSFDAPGCEYLLNRLDGVIGDAFQKPISKIFLVLRGGKNPIENYFYERYLRKGIAFRKLPTDRVVVIPTTGDKRLRLEFWISDSGRGRPNVRETPFELALPVSSRRVPFVRDTVEVVKFDGNWEYMVGDCAACCIETLDMNLLSKLLQANPDLNARIRVYTRRGSIWKRLAKLLRHDARSQHIDDTRARIVFGGRDKGIEQLASNLATVDVVLSRSR